MNPADRFTIVAYFAAHEDLDRWQSVCAHLLDPEGEAQRQLGQLGQWRGATRRHQCSDEKPGRPAGRFSRNSPGTGNAKPVEALARDYSQPKGHKDELST